jgi:hypothetical protein
MKQLNLLHNKLLDEDDLDILYPHVAKIASDDKVFKILISWEFYVKNPEVLNTIVDNFDEFTNYLNLLSF